MHKIAGGDVRSLLQVLGGARDKLIAAGFDDVEIHTCYEIGYDGFWLHRLLEQEGTHNHVLDSASIQVSRRSRHLKTDRLDAEALVRVLLALLRGERRVCSVVRVPTPREEDEKRLHRSRAVLVRDRTRYIARICLHTADPPKQEPLKRPPDTRDVPPASRARRSESLEPAAA